MGNVQSNFRVCNNLRPSHFNNVYFLYVFIYTPIVKKNNKKNSTWLITKHKNNHSNRGNMQNAAQQ